MLYDLWVVAADPVLAGWNAQNQTPSPPLWDLLISLLPALLLAMVGAWGVIRWRKQKQPTEIGSTENWFPLLLWVGLGLLLLFIPWSLQRRFILGIYIPIAGLAALGMEFLAAGRPRRYRILVVVVFILAIPTNLIVLLAGGQAINTYDPKIYLTKEENLALTWIGENTDDGALVLSSPEMGLFIPAHTGRQVIYGHPFETVNADYDEKVVIDFYSGDNSASQMQEFIDDRGVDYIFFGPRENALGPIVIPISWKVVFQSSDVILYSLE